MDKSLTGSDTAILVVYLKIKVKYTVFRKTLPFNPVEYSGRNGAARDPRAIWLYVRATISPATFIFNVRKKRSQSLLDPAEIEPSKTQLCVVPDCYLIFFIILRLASCV